MRSYIARTESSKDAVVEPADQVSYFACAELIPVPIDGARVAKTADRRCELGAGGIGISTEKFERCLIKLSQAE